jgi:hypothetical protein
MKDFILGSDEYLIQSQELLSSLVSPHQPPPHPPGSPLNGTSPPPEIPTGSGALDDNIQINEKRTGLTSLHFFNEAVHQLQHLHDQIARNKQTSTGKRLRDTSSTIFHLTVKSNYASQVLHCKSKRLQNRSTTSNMSSLLSLKLKM